MIIIIFAPPRTGKTCLMTHLLREQAFNRERNKAMWAEIDLKNNNGFNLSRPPHCVSANYACIFKKFGCSPRVNRIINPFRLGFKNEFVETHFNFPYEVIGITEAQKYLNSRLSMYFPAWQSRWYEQHGHQNLDIYLDTQRPMLIDVNIRELATFIEVVKLDIDYDNRGKVCKLTWLVREIANSQLFDRYMSSGKKDKDCYSERIITADYNVFSCYDSQSCKPKFYDGHIGADFDYQQACPAGETLEDYVNFLKENDDELPNGYFQKRKNL